MIVSPQRPRSGVRQSQRRRWLPSAALGVLLLAAIATPRPLGAESHWAFLKARAAKERLQIRIGGSDRTYYRLDATTPVEFSASGPTRVRLITRPLDTAEGARRASYGLRVTRGAGKKLVLLKEIYAEESEAVVCAATGDAVGEGEESLLHVPRGKWDFRLYLHESDTDVAVRLLQEERRKEELLVHCPPESFDAVHVLVQPSGNEYPHYHFTRMLPLRARLRGPAPVSIRTRLDFPSGGLEIAPYGIEVIGWKAEEGELRRRFRKTRHYWSQRLEKTHYRDTDALCPGENMEFPIDLPAGEWVLEIRPIDIEIPGATARILAPKRALIEE
ncbi:MAG: hypothetical protein GF330_06215 [Candidatus Eisenbacteria bacterium]|nr:hypothetical protein [Candidatus Eisenbacteria bacterium]